MLFVTVCAFSCGVLLGHASEMIGNILLLCFLATAVGGVLYPDLSIYPDLQFRRQLGETRDSRVPPQYTDALRNTRRHHKPILRNEKPFQLSETVLRKEKPVLPVSQELLNIEGVLPRQYKRVFVRYSDLLKGDSDYHGLRNEKKCRPLKRQGSIRQKHVKGTHADAEFGDDTNVENYIPNEGTTNDLTRPESSQVQMYYPVQFNEPKGISQGHITSQSQNQLFNVPQGRPQGYYVNQGQEPINNGPQSQFEGPITDSLDQNRDYNAYQGEGNYNPPQGPGNPPNGQSSAPQWPGYGPPVVRQEYNANQGLGQEYKPPQGPGNPSYGQGSTPQGPYYPQPNVGQEYNANQGLGQDYKPPQGPGNPSYGQGSTPQGPYYPPPNFGQEYNENQGLDQDYIPPQGPGNPSYGQGSTPQGPYYPPPNFGQEYNENQGLDQDYKPPQGPGNPSYGQGSTPQRPYYPPPNVGQEYNANQGLDQDYIPPQGPGNPSYGQGSTPQGPYYPPPDVGQEYNASQSLGQDYKPPQGPGNPSYGQGITPQGPYYPPPDVGQEYNSNQGLGQDYIPPQGTGNPSYGQGSAPQGPYYPPPNVGQEYNANQGMGQDYKPPQDPGNPSYGQSNAPQGPGNSPYVQDSAQGPYYRPPYAGQENNAYQGTGKDYYLPQGPGNPPNGQEGALQGPYYRPPDDGQEYNANQDVDQDYTPQGPVYPPLSPENALDVLPEFGESFNKYPGQKEILDNCQLTSQCYPKDSYEARLKLLQLIQETIFAIDRKVMPIRQVHLAYKAHRLYKIGYLVSSVKRTYSNVADLYKYLKQNLNTWDFLKVLQAYEQVKLADAFLTDILYTLNQIASNLNVFVIRSRKSNDQEVQDHRADEKKASM